MGGHEGLDDGQHGLGLGLVALKRTDISGNPEAPVSRPASVSKYSVETS
jgi:hypothetical protein